MNRNAKAFLIVPIVPAVLFSILLCVLSVIDGGFPTSAKAVKAMPVWFAFSLPVSYGIALVIGMPLFLLFRRFGCLTRSSVVGGAGSLGVVVGVAVGALFGAATVLELVVAASIFSLFGVASGFVFWGLSCAAPNHALNTEAPSRRSG